MIQFESISKRFKGVQALHDVGFCLERGHVLGLIGENGAGKSTLMNILGGVIQPDAGQMWLDRQLYAPRTPADAAGVGIAFIHQELNLFTNLSVADNLFIDTFPRRGRWPWIDRRTMRERTRGALELVELDLEPGTPVEALAPGERQLVEIARALSRDARLILFDEPTTSLTARETERLFDLIRRLRTEGTTIIYISHTLSDVQALTDDLVVLRDGKLVAEGPTSTFTIDRMIAAMVGRDLEQVFPDQTTPPSPEPVLEVQGVTQTGVVQDVSFMLKRGEVLGMFGLMGSGRTELARILFGLDPLEAGEILLEGQPVQRISTRERIAAGMAFVTEDRREEGLLMEAPVVDNVGLVTLTEFAMTPLQIIDRRALRAEVERVAGQLRLRAGSLDRQPVKSLSGGNQQKAVLGKWLVRRPTVLLLDEPTRGIDVGAKTEVYALVRDLAAEGTGVLCISSEIEELIGLCDRILVMNQGTCGAAFERSAFDQETILRAAFGQTTPPLRGTPP